MMRDSLRRLASDDRMSPDSPPPPPRRLAMRRVKVELLDGETLSLDIERKASGGALLDVVCARLDVALRDYFGLQRAARGDPRVWVDLNRRLAKTFKNEPWEVRFAVKFYPPEPSELEDEVARDQLLLAVKRDLLEGRLTCSFITHALLASYVLQAELGDHEGGRASPGALQRLQAAPNSALTPELEDKIEELYKMHVGQNPAEAVLNYLENAKKLSLYGAELHCARDAEDADLLLAVSAGGVAVYRDAVLMNRFPWAKITKISYNKRAFALKLRPSEFDECETTVGFRLPSVTACKKLWRCGVEHHMFFRRAEPVPVKKIPGLPGLGSRRLSCRRTLRQMRDAAVDHARQTEVAA